MRGVEATEVCLRGIEALERARCRCKTDVTSLEGDPARGG